MRTSPRCGTSIRTRSTRARSKRWRRWPIAAGLDRRFGVTGADLQAVASAVGERLPAAWEHDRDAFARSTALGGDIGNWIDRTRTVLHSAR
ncbi:hypothetical protein; putative signal peptide [Frankia alni ACN14a]|uniref:Uncharacterized protein n=1 Tax=Frankia alni (strain DSM 45986 / CECT 9034 / ACN14a) TaxID=326424 RepID=Q0RNZ1_FRAAA|nr:hypothetical protein; putative signal peptide [Frankia alni ACN14a]